MKVGKGVLVLFALVLAACSTPAEPTSLETPTRMPEVDVQQSPEPSRPPAEPAAEVDAFARVYIETANDALVDRESLAAWRTMFLDTCEVCLAGHTTTEQIWDAGQSIVGGDLGDWQLSVEDVTTNAATMVVTGTIDAAEVVSSDGTVVESYPEVRPVTIVYTATRRSDGAWLMATGQLVQ